LRAKLKKTTGAFDKQKIEKRIANFTLKSDKSVSVETLKWKQKNAKYLVDDAVAATEAALKDGIVPGGGTTYIELSKRLDGSTDGHTLLKEALEYPFKVLMQNAGERAGVKL
jgi:chaperonin GroEL